MTQSFHQFVEHNVEQILRRDGQAMTVAEMVDEIRHTHASMLEGFGPSMVLDALHRRVRSALRHLSDASTEADQLQFPGLDLPSAVCYLDESGDYRYIETAKANLDQLRSQLDIRNNNADAATHKARVLAESIEELTPHMGDGCTVAEAITRRQITETA